MKLCYKCFLHQHSIFVIYFSSEGVECKLLIPFCCGLGPGLDSFNKVLITNWMVPLPYKCSRPVDICQNQIFLLFTYRMFNLLPIGDNCIELSVRCFA